MVDKIKLGKDGPWVSKIGFGCMGLSGHYEEARDEESMATLQEAYQLGVNFFDTADVYGNGHNERLLGQALREVLNNHREELVIATKCGFAARADGTAYMDFSFEYIKQACERSLERLRVNYIDVYYLHRQPPEKDFENSIRALVDLLKEEKIHHVGLSEFDVPSIERANDLLTEAGYPHALVAVQSELSLLSPDVLHNEVMDICNKNNISFVAFSPLSRALLAAPEKIHRDVQFAPGDFRRVLPRFQEQNFEYNLCMRDQLLSLAKEQDCSLPQLALAWVIAQGSCVVPIPGTRTIKHLRENLGALNIRLSTADIETMNRVVVEGASGERYTEAMFQEQGITRVPVA